MENALEVSKHELVSADEGVFLDLQLFEHAQRVAKMFAASTMVPEHFRSNVGNCMIALNFAARTKLDPFMVMQKMYVIQGRPGIEGQLAIALINNSKRFSPLQFRLEGEGKSRKCTAYAKNRETGETCEQTVSWDMVEKEGWCKKAGSKWNTMPDLMFQYRSAAFFGRMYCPEALLGMMTKEELYDIPKDTPVNNLAEKLKSLPRQENPLHKTDAWRKWTEAKENCPDIAEGMQEPATEQQCIEATRHIIQKADEAANQESQYVKKKI